MAAELITRVSIDLRLCSHAAGLDPKFEFSIGFYYRTIYAHRLDQKHFRIKVIDKRQLRRDLTIGAI